MADNRLRLYGRLSILVLLLFVPRGGAADPPAVLPIQKSTAELTATGRVRYHGFSPIVQNDHRVDPRAIVVLFVPINVSQMPKTITQIEVSCKTSLLPEYYPDPKTLPPGVNLASHIPITGGGYVRRALDHGAFKGTIAVSLGANKLTQSPRDAAFQLRSYLCELKGVETATRPPTTLNEYPLEPGAPAKVRIQSQIW